MKKILSVLLAFLLLLSVTACAASAPDEPEDKVLKADVAEYIREFISKDGKLSIFEKQTGSLNKRTDKYTYTAICIAYFDVNGEQNSGTFNLSYSFTGKEWELEKCTAKLDNLSGVSSSSAASSNVSEEPEDTADQTSSSAPAADSAEPVSLSDDWKDFTFVLEGVTYQLPAKYQSFVDNGWKIDQTRGNITEDSEIAAKTYEMIRLTNGAVTISADLLNMSGNVRVAKDCNIGGLTIYAKNNLDFQVAGGISCLSTVEDVQEKFGAPNSSNNYDGYSTLHYTVSTYQSVSFTIYKENTTSNTISISHFVETDDDITDISTERPAYLDDYKAPAELGSDKTSVIFKLDGVLYQLPCPLNAFTDNGWTIKSDSTGSLGGRNKSSFDVTLTKGDVTFYVGMINYSNTAQYTKDCAVYKAEFDKYYFKNDSAGLLVLPSGVTLISEDATVASVYSDFDVDDYSSSISYNHYNDDYTYRVTYRVDKSERKENSYTIENQEWNY